MARAGRAQHSGAFVRRRPCRHHVVNQQYRTVPDLLSIPDHEGSPYVAPSIGSAESDLRRGRTASRQHERVDRTCPFTTDRASEGKRLIEASPAKSVPMQRNRNHQVVIKCHRQLFDQKLCQHRCHGDVPPVFESRQHLHEWTRLAAIECGPCPRLPEFRETEMAVRAQVVWSLSSERNAAGRAQRGAGWEDLPSTAGAEGWGLGSAATGWTARRVKEVEDRTPMPHGGMLGHAPPGAQRVSPGPCEPGARHPGRRNAGRNAFDCGPVAVYTPPRGK